MFFIKFERTSGLMVKSPLANPMIVQAELRGLRVRFPAGAFFKMRYSVSVEARIEESGAKAAGTASMPILGLESNGGRIHRCTCSTSYSLSEVQCGFWV